MQSTIYILPKTRMCRWFIFIGLLNLHFLYRRNREREEESERGLERPKRANTKMHKSATNKATVQINCNVLLFPFLSVKFRFRCVHNERYCYAIVRSEHRTKLFFPLMLSRSHAFRRQKMSNSSLILLYVLRNFKWEINIESRNDECDGDYYRDVKCDDDDEDGFSWEIVSYNV